MFGGFFSGVPPWRDWFFGVRTFAASMLALYLALFMQLPRPYWAMATVYIVSSPFVGPTSSKALYRVLGTLLGAAAAVFFVPLLGQAPLLLSAVIGLWAGTLLFLSMHLRTSNNYVLMLASYSMPLIALPVLDQPERVFEVAVSRSEEILLGIVCAAVVGAVFWPRRLAPVMLEASGRWFDAAARYSALYLGRHATPEELASLRAAMVTQFNGLEPMIGQLPHEGARPAMVRSAKELRGRMIHLLPVVDALDDALWALQRRAPALMERLQPLLEDACAWLQEPSQDASEARWRELSNALERLRPDGERLADRQQLLFSHALYRLAEWLDLWQDCRVLQQVLRADGRLSWRAVYRHWRLGRLSPFHDHGLMAYAALSTMLASTTASVLWILLGWDDGGGGVILATVACCFFAAMDDPAPQIYRFFFWTTLSVLFASLYLFLVLPNLHDFPMLVLAFAVPFICIGTLTVQPRFYLGTLLTLVNTASFISIQSAYDANFQNFLNANFSGPIGLLFAFVWTLVMRPFGSELALRRLTRFGWEDIAELGEPGTLNEHRRMAVRLLDRLMQQLPRLAQTGQDSSMVLRELRVALNLLDLLAYLPRVDDAPRQQLQKLVEDVAAHYRACLAAGERLAPPRGLLMDMDRIRRALLHSETARAPQALAALLHALSGLRLALLPGVEIPHEASEAQEQPPHGIDGAPL